MNPETGEPLQTQKPLGKGVTIALSPLEVAGPNSYPRFDAWPYLYVLRWRPRSYYEQHADLAEQTRNIRWKKSPSKRKRRATAASHI